MGIGASRLTRSPCLPTMVPGSLSITTSGKERDVRVKYSSSPLGEGKGGSRSIIFKEVYYPLQWGHRLGSPGPPDLGCGRAGLGPGVGRMGDKGLPRKEGSGWGLGSGCLRLSIPLLLYDVLCRLVLYLFFLIEIRAGAGDQGKDQGRGCSRAWGQSWEPLPSYGAGTEPHSKLLINCWLF